MDSEKRRHALSITSDNEMATFEGEMVIGLIYDKEGMKTAAVGSFDSYACVAGAIHALCDLFGEDTFIEAADDFVKGRTDDMINKLMKKLGEEESEEK